MLVFRMDRVCTARVLDVAAEGPADFRLGEFWSDWERAYAASLPTFVTRVRLGPLAQRFRDAFGSASPRVVADCVCEADGWVRQTLTFDGPAMAAAMLLALAPEVEVLDPPELRARMLAAAQAFIDRNGRLGHADA